MTAEQEKRMSCFLFLTSKAMFQKNKDNIKARFRKRLHPSSPFKLPCPEDKSLLIKMKRSHEGEGKGLNARARRSGT